MMDKNSYQAFTKKIIPYLDGSLSKDETQEFEAFVLTHPEIEEQIKSKKEEMELLRKMIPHAELSAASRETLEVEFKSSIFNLLKEEPKSLMDTVRIKLEDWINR